MVNRLRRIAAKQRKSNEERDKVKETQRKYRIRVLNTLNGFSNEIIELAYKAIERNFDSLKIQILEPSSIQGILESQVIIHPHSHEFRILTDLDLDSDLLTASRFWRNKDFQKTEETLKKGLEMKIGNFLYWCQSEGYKTEVKIYFIGSNSFRVSLTISW